METGVPDVRRSDASGPAAHVRCTISELRRLGHEVRLVAQFGREIWRSDDWAQFERVHVPGRDDGMTRGLERAVRRLQGRLRLPYVSYFDSRRFSAACASELKDRELLYERMGWMALGGSLAARRLGMPHVLEVNGDHLAELSLLGAGPGAVQRRVSVWLMRRTVQRAAHAIATGEGWRARHVQRWHVDPRRVSVVDNGSELVDLLAREQLRCFSDDTHASSPLRVAYVGSFDPWQNLPRLLSAVSRATAAGVDLAVTLAGTGPEAPALKQLAIALNMRGRITFAGVLAPGALAEVLRVCDVGVSLYSDRPEYRGLKLLDYKAAGLATIATGTRGEPRLIEDGKTGLIISPGNEEALCSALAWMAADRQRVREMGRRARMEAEARHRWRHTAEALSGLFAKILEDRDHSPASLAAVERPRI
jgi:glycosyltransferase involved in cell wall biosynthesis